MCDCNIYELITHHVRCKRERKREKQKCEKNSHTAEYRSERKVVIRRDRWYRRKKNGDKNDQKKKKNRHLDRTLKLIVRAYVRRYSLGIHNDRLHWLQPIDNYVNYRRYQVRIRLYVQYAAYILYIWTL